MDFEVGQSTEGDVILIGCETIHQSLLQDIETFIGEPVREDLLVPLGKEGRHELMYIFSDDLVSFDIQHLGH